jgi:hypothetical protein
MDTIMKVLKESEYLKRLVKLTKRKKNEEISKNQVATVNNTFALKGFL